jgi:hypothetical protein
MVLDQIIKSTERKGAGKMNVLKMVVSKKSTEGANKGEYVKVGEVDVPIFSLKEFGIEVEDTGVDKTEGSDGLLTYASPAVQYVYDSLVAATKADARNKLESGKATIKAGCKIASTVEELIEKAERSGAALALNREFVADFIKYLAEKSGKNATVQALYSGLVKNRQTIALNSEARRNGLMTQIEAYTDWASKENVEKFTNILTTIAELCTSTVEIEDDAL